MAKKCSQEDFDRLSQVVAVLQAKLAQQELNEPSFPSTSFSPAPKSLIQIDTKIKLVPFDGSIDAEKVDAWIRDLEVYFESQGFADDQRCLFAKLKLTKHSLLWWDSLCSRRAKAGLDPISVWADMKEQIRKKFYPMDHKQQLVKRWHHLRQLSGQAVQDYIDEFHKLSI
eukprot:Gb_05300 [translate_table: standard]